MLPSRSAKSQLQEIVTSLVADVALAVRQEPIAGDRDLARHVLRLGDGPCQGQAGKGVERAGGALPVR